jgi:hypothetical protein
MSVVKDLHELKQKGGLQLLYDVTISVIQPDGGVLTTGHGSNNVLAAAGVQAAAQVVDVVRTFANAKKRSRAETWGNDFTHKMYLHLGHPSFKFIDTFRSIAAEQSGENDVDALRHYVQRLVNAAANDPTSVLWIGMDSEGHKGESAKYAQFCGGDELGTVVVSLTTDVIDLLKPLFRTANIGLVVVDAGIEAKKLGPLFTGGDTTSLYDLQDLAMICMGLKSKPSQVTLTNYLLGEHEPKLIKMANLHPDLQPYETFEHQKELPSFLQMYAAVDAMATLWAFELFKNQASQDQLEASGLEGWLVRRLAARNTEDLPPM